MFAGACSALGVWVSTKIQSISGSSILWIVRCSIWFGFYSVKVASAPWGMKPNRGDLPDVNGQCRHNNLESSLEPFLFPFSGWYFSISSRSFFFCLTTNQIVFLSVPAVGFQPGIGVMAFTSRIGNVLRRTSVPNSPLLHAVRCMSSSKLFVAGMFISILFSSGTFWI